MRISLRAGEKIYMNGAVFSVDRKVSLELLNDVAFLLEAHILQAKDANTPVKQLYFIIQLMLMDPVEAVNMHPAAEKMFAVLRAKFHDEEFLMGLERAYDSFSTERLYEALKKLRALYPLENILLQEISPSVPYHKLSFEGETACR